MNPNVKYELSELERLLSEVDIEVPDERSGKTLNEVVDKETERIKQTFIHEVFTFEDERHLERYIQYHQQAIIRHMDKLSLVGQSDDPTSIDKIFYDAFEELLIFVERHFTKYFDQDAKAPEGYIKIIRKDIQLNIKKFQKAFASKNADSRIIDVLLKVMKTIVDFKTGGITYRKVMYAKEVQRELFRVLNKTSDQENIDEELRSAMYYLNYNSVKALTYHAHYISSLLDTAETRAEKIEKLSFLIKNINQAQVKPGIRYNQSATSLKDQLNLYITEEMEYQERLQRLSGNPPERSGDNFLYAFKLKFETSVSQLAYLIRIFMETKIILNSNLSQILHFIARFAITKRSENISYSSLRAKYYNVETGTKESVKVLLTSMIRYIDEN